MPARCEISYSIQIATQCNQFDYNNNKNRFGKKEEWKNAQKSH